MNLDPGRCDCFSSAGSSKIKIRTSSCNKAHRALSHNVVQILIFDDPAENERSQRPEFRYTQLYNKCTYTAGIHIQLYNKFSLYELVVFEDSSI